jgi:hypothetical protein
VSTAKRTHKPKQDGYLVGISREPIVIKIPGNVAAAFRAWAQLGEEELLEAIFDNLRAGGQLALEQCGREDVPALGKLEQLAGWLMDGAVVQEAVALEAPAELITSATSRAKGLGMSLNEYVNALLSLHLDVERKPRTGRISVGA